MCNTDKHHPLEYERTDDMSVLSDFYCGIYDMDKFIHSGLQRSISERAIECYIVRMGGAIVAILALCDNIVKFKLDSRNVEIDSVEIEYLAVEKSRREQGIGRQIIDWIIDKVNKERPDINILSVKAYRDLDIGYSAEPFYSKCAFRIISTPHPMQPTVKMARFIR